MLIRFPLDKSFESFSYPAGERQVRFTDEGVKQIKMADKIQVLARVRSSQDVIDLLMLSNALHNHSKRRETELILPYFPYARADRRFTNGDCFGLEVFRTLIDVQGYNKVTTLDAHSPVTRRHITSLFEDVSPVSFIDQAWHGCVGNTHLLTPDSGASLRYVLKGLHCEKKRDPATGKLSGFVVPPKKKFESANSILIVDDICDGGGTFIGIAEELRKQGVTQPLYLYVTHGIFSQGFAKLTEHFETIFTTNSFQATYPTFHPIQKVVVFDCEPALLGREI